ncbi:ATP-binding protein [Pseudomonas sp. KU26590]|uniref:ATP-binding protein n=1 Tax=Pseudomonas sp. KU26590 TaxID=2991051 RepID=UPI00223E4BE1|nr:ATP-binding protein [Pseudomonas sp. KU26590]UZJ58232.1 ATP-binding protein [Pseudomonas sp. KU26590]
MDFVAKDFSGLNSITHSGITKHFKNVAPCQALAELVWNGLDAGASKIDVLVESTDTGGTISVTIVDNGSGINFNKPDDNFRRFNDSLKKDSFDSHGSQGRGRLAFHKICNTATWHTRYENVDAKIQVFSSNLSAVSGTTISASEQLIALAGAESGTCVTLSHFDKNLPPTGSIIHEFSKEFGAHLVLMPQKEITVNGDKVLPQPHTKSSTLIQTKLASFDVDLIQWEDKPGAEKSFLYFVSRKLKTIYKQYSSLNKKRDYYTSVFVKSSFLERYVKEEGALSEPFDAFLVSEDYRILIREMNGFLRTSYANFLIGKAQEQVDAFEKAGDFPDYDALDVAESKWRLSHVKEIVKAVLIREPRLFVGGNKRQRRLIIRLLDKLSVSSENSGIFEVLESVLNLDAAAMKQLADQLKKTKLDNIIQTIEILQHRELAVCQLKEIMNVHYKDVLETPDLQKIIENNTWLFGPAYEILGAEEDTFTTTAKNLRSKVKDITAIELADLASGVDIDGANRQVDLLLVRKKLQFDAKGRRFFRCVIVEIKRPGVSLNNKHLNQLDEYAAILSHYPEFNSELTRFELILIGRSISKGAYSIHSRLKSSEIHGEPGLLTNDNKIKTYIKTWPTIFDEFEITNDYLLDNLKTQRASLSSRSKEELLESLQKESV